jgi:hypothetical protein
MVNSSIFYNLNKYLVQIIKQDRQYIHKSIDIYKNDDENKVVNKLKTLALNAVVDSF